MVSLAALIVSDLDGYPLLLKFLCFAAAVSWSFARLGTGPGIGALCLATLATDYWVIDPIYSISLDGWTAATMAAYAAIALLVLRFGVSKELSEPDPK